MKLAVFAARINSRGGQLLSSRPIEHATEVTAINESLAGHNNPGRKARIPPLLKQRHPLLLPQRQRRGQTGLAANVFLPLPMSWDINVAEHGRRRAAGLG